MVKRKITTFDIERCVADFFTPRINLVIPNVHWGFLRYEADLIILTKSGCLYEVEIKISLSDLKADFKKRRFHDDKRIKYVYYAVPHYLLEKAEPLIPEWAGILAIKPKAKNTSFMTHDQLYAYLVRPPTPRSKYKATTQDRAVLGRLGTLRIWALKKKLYKLQRQVAKNK